MVAEASQLFNAETSERGLRESHEETLGAFWTLDTLWRLDKSTALVDSSQGLLKISRMFQALMDVFVPETDRAAEQALFQAFSAQKAHILASFRSLPSWVSPRST